MFLSPSGVATIDKIDKKVLELLNSRDQMVNQQKNSIMKKEEDLEDRDWTISLQDRTISQQKNSIRAEREEFDKTLVQKEQDLEKRD